MTPWSYGLRDEILQATYDFFGDEVIEADELQLPSIISLQKRVGFFDTSRLVAIILPEGNFGFVHFLCVFLDGILIGSGKGGVFVSFFKFEDFYYYEENTLTFLRMKGKGGIRITADWLNAKVGEFFVSCREKALPWRNILRKAQPRSGYKRPRLSEKRLWKLWKKNECLLNKKVSCSKIPVSEEEWERVRYLMAESEKRGRAWLTKILNLYNGVV